MNNHVMALVAGSGNVTGQEDALGNLTQSYYDAAAPSWSCRTSLSRARSRALP